MRQGLLSVIVFSIFLLTVVPAESSKNNSTHSKTQINLHPDNWKTSEIATLLKKGKLISIRSIHDYLSSQKKKVRISGEVYLVEFDNGLKGVFKVFPQKSLNIMDGYGEVVAYEASVALGFPYVPPTIMTTIGERKGSLQLFVETKINTSTLKAYEDGLKYASEDDVANLNLFRFIFGQWDTWPRNTLIFEDNGKAYPVAIDNAGICKRQYAIYGDLPFVEYRCSPHFQTNDWNKEFPFFREESITEPEVEKIRRVFGKKLSNTFYKELTAPPPYFHYVTYQGCVWKQRHIEEANIVLSFTDHLPEKTRKILEKLDLFALKKIFACAQNAEFVTPAYLQDILDRRDQVLRYFKTKEDKQQRNVAVAIKTAPMPKMTN